MLEKKALRTFFDPRYLILNFSNSDALETG